MLDGVDVGDHSVVEPQIVGVRRCRQNERSEGDGAEAMDCRIMNNRTPYCGWPVCNARPTAATARSTAGHNSLAAFRLTRYTPW